MGMSFRIIDRAVRQWSQNQDTSAGAALAFYAVFAIVPLLFVAIFSCATIFGQERSTRQIERGVYRAIGPEIGADAAELLENLQKRIVQKIKGTFTAGQFWTIQFWTLAGSIVVHIACVLALFLQARLTVCVIWKIQNTQANTIWLIVVDYLLALAMLSFIVLVLFTSLIIGSWVRDAPFLGNLFSFLMLALALAVSYRVMSANKIAWRNVSYGVPWGYVWYGSAVASLLFLVGKTLLQQYLVNLYVEDEFYEGGFLVVFLLWVYYCSQAFFFGAELIQARRTRSEWLNSSPSAE